MLTDHADLERHLAIIMEKAAAHVQRGDSIGVNARLVPVLQDAIRRIITEKDGEVKPEEIAEGFAMTLSNICANVIMNLCPGPGQPLFMFAFFTQIQDMTRRQLQPGASGVQRHELKEHLNGGRA